MFYVQLPSLHSLAICSLTLLSFHCASGQQPSVCKHPALGPGIVPSVGFVRASIIFVDFPDVPANESIESLGNAFSNASIPSFFSKSSFNQTHLTITPASSRYVRMPSASTSYRWGTPLSETAHMKYVSDALSAVGNNVSFAGTQLLYVVAARCAKAISFSATGFFSLVAGDGTVIPGVITTGADFLSPLYSTASGVSLTAYSMGLRLQCPDISNDATVDQYIGGFSPMCDLVPLAPDFLARQKWTFGWLDSGNQVACLNHSLDSSQPLNQTLTLSAVENLTDVDPTLMSSISAKLAVIPVTTSLTLYAEARTQTGIDQNACLSGFGAGGVLLYTAGDGVTASPGDPDPISLVNPQQNSYPSGCGSSHRGFLALLGLSSVNQVSSFIISNTGIRVSVLGENGARNQFRVRFESGISASTTTSSATATSSVSQPSQTSIKSLAGGRGSTTYKFPVTLFAILTGTVITFAV